MKEKFKNMKKRITEDRRRMAGILIAALLLAVIGGNAFAAENMGNDTSTADKVVTITNDKPEQEEDVDKEKKEQEEKIEDKNSTEKNKKSGEADSTVSNKTAAASEKTGSSGASTQKQTTDSSKASSPTASTGSSGNSGGSGSSPQGTAGNSTPSSSAGGSSSGSTQPSQPAPEPTQPTEPTQPSEPVHVHDWQPQYTTEQEWVVDQVAWAETVSEPVYEQKLVWYCNTCGEDVTSNPEGHVDETMHEGYKSDYVSVQTGTNTYTINHPEEGHYESSSVLTGYKCSCGATK